MAREFVMGAKLTLKDMFARSMRQAVRETKNASAEVRRFQTQARGAASGILSLKGAMIGLGGGVAIKKGFDWLVGANADMETFQNTLTVVMGSQAKAIETLAWAQKFAAKTPFEIPQVVEATTRMAAYGLNAQDTLGIVGDMASVMGKDLMQAVEAVADAQTGELERLKEFGITKGMIQAQAKEMKMRVINNKGQITDQKGFNAALFALMEKRYKGGMELQSHTFHGMMSNATDFIGTMGRTLGKPIFGAISAGLSKALDWLNKMQENGTIDLWVGRIQHFGAVVWDVFTSVFKEAWDRVMLIKQGITDFYNTNKPQIDKIGQAFADAFATLAAYAGPILIWLYENALPILIATLSTVGEWVLNVATFFIDNWSWIGPLVEGIVIALGGYLAIIYAIRAGLLVWAAAQWLLNVAMDANPIGIIIMLIGLLIGAGILIVKNWDKIKKVFGDVWGGIVKGFKMYVNMYIDLLNVMINGVNQAFSFDLPGWLGGGHFELGIPVIPRLQLDGSHLDGLPRVPFDGYIAELHKDEGVLTSQENRAYRAGKAPGSPPAASAQTAHQPIQLTVHVHGAQGQDVDSLASKVVGKVVDMLEQAGAVVSGTGKGVLLPNG